MPHCPNTVDTPIRPKISHTPHSQRAATALARDDVAFDLGPIPLVSWEDFVGHVLPPLPEVLGLVDGIVLELESKGELLDNRWRQFPVNPSQVKPDENIVFAPFTQIWDNTIGCAEMMLASPSTVTPRQTSAVTKIVLKPTESNATEMRNDAQPDGMIVVKVTTAVTKIKAKPKKTHWCDAIASMECKKRCRHEDRRDNAKKLIYNCTHIMRNDPCRRFTFGITIEDTELRVWFFARSGVMVTEPIQWLTEPSKLVHILVSLAFADKLQLGYDPTVKRVKTSAPNGNVEVQYQYTVGDEVYVTTGLPLCDFRADSVEGRSTRVWKAYRLSDPTKTEVALKDIWMTKDSKTEGDTLRMLTSDMTPLEAQHFLTVVCDGVVTINGEDDNTHTLAMRGVPPKVIGHYLTATPDENSKIPISQLITPGSQRTRSRGHTPHTTGPKRVQDKRVTFTERVHYRIIFKEVGKPLHEILSFKTVCSALCDIVKALEVLHKKKVVHRDISTGNILVYKKRGILSDLEYSKMLVDLPQARHDVITGTAQFMAVEVSARSFLFQPKVPVTEKVLPSTYISPKQNDDCDSDRGDMDFEEVDPVDVGPSQPPEAGKLGPQEDSPFGETSAMKEPGTLDEAQPQSIERSGSTAPGAMDDTLKPFRYGYLHDIESVFWVVVWWLFHHIPQQDLDPVRRTEQTNEAMLMFPADGFYAHRYTVLSNDDVWKGSVRALSQRFNNAVTGIGTLRDSILLAYAKTYVHLSSSAAPLLVDSGQSGVSIYDVVRKHLANTRTRQSLVRVASILSPAKRGLDESDGSFNDSPTEPSSKKLRGG